MCLFLDFVLFYKVKKKLLLIINNYIKISSGYNHHSLQCSSVVLKTVGSLCDLPLLTYALLRKMTITPRKLNKYNRALQGRVQSAPRPASKGVDCPYTSSSAICRILIYTSSDKNIS